MNSSSAVVDINSLGNIECFRRNRYPELTPAGKNLERIFIEKQVPSYDQMGVTLSRSSMQNLKPLQLDPPSVKQVRDILVPGKDGMLPARVYNPDPSQQLPLIVYLHGGGWVIGDIESVDQPARRLCAATNCIVVSVGYRCAPETPFPGPLLDCVAAIEWLAANSDPLQASNRLVVAGDSAGGNLAAAACQYLCDRGKVKVDAQVLIYPCITPPVHNQSASMQQYANDRFLSQSAMEWFWDMYIGAGNNEKDARFYPLCADSLSRLPPTLMVYAEMDVLVDEALAYAGALIKANVPVTNYLMPGVPHGFWWLDSVFSEASEVNLFIAEALQPYLR